MKQVYEDRSANPAEAAKVNDLEKELQRTKDYYHKRIRELEDKYKFKQNIGTADDAKVKQLSSKTASKEPKKADAKQPEKVVVSSDVQKEV